MKAVLVIDVPKSCWDCICNEVDDNGISWCNVLRKETTKGHIERQSWCPLKPMPEKKESKNIHPFFECYADGWNDCLDYITGDEE